MKPETGKTDAGDTDLNRDEIEKQAYFYWLEGGCQDGFHEDDWLRAERHLGSQESANRQAA